MSQHDDEQPWIAYAEIVLVARRFDEELLVWGDDLCAFVATTDGRTAYWEDVRAFK